MSESLYVRLSNIMDDLARLARAMDIDQSPHQFALERLVARLDALVEETIGLETAHQEDDD